uniref:FIST C-domain domain-containing protein n=1 Tax=Pseudo-nitzschia australis TaxID=44445 RepID=A0A7S4EMS7_9STRA|mmetsp:Transcript_8818/g.19044  ORF Transcript_8818/g.19044 Transcript_8818/m.19044 type:complete len:610 (-) Transcript_8818:77-1906(-)
MEESMGSNLLEDFISSDLMLRIIQYLNVADNGRLACTSQRYYYLAHQYRRFRGPEIAITTDLIALAELEKTTPTEQTLYNTDQISSTMMKDCKQKLQVKPNLILGFSTPSDLAGAIKRELSFPASPSTSNIISLNVVAHQRIQVSQPAAGQGLQYQQPKLDSKSKASLMAMNFPGATILPYVIRGRPNHDDLVFLEQRLRYHSKINNNGNANESSFWKAMILYAVGNGVESSDQITNRMQTLMPNAVIVGGACREGFVSMPTYKKEELSSMSIKHLKHVLKYCCPNATHQDILDPAVAAKMDIVEKSDLVDYVYAAHEKEEEVTRNMHSSMSKISGAGIIGVFLGGNVPIKSVVSRGVHSVLNNNGPPLPHSNLIVQEESLTTFGHNQPPIHLIHKIRDDDTGIVYSSIQLMDKYGPSAESTIDFLGLKRRGQDGFQLKSLNELTQAMGAFAILTDGSETELESMEGAELDFFCLNGKACMEDMDRTMLQLRQQTEGEEILGALMYTCNGRGPEPGCLIPEEMSDAKRFANAFPRVPCLGFYAAGEYGPVALAGNENIFQTGRASLQGFTAVFALFVVPVKNLPATYDLDDSIHNVQQFVRHQLHQKMQ